VISAIPNDVKINNNGGIRFFLIGTIVVEGIRDGRKSFQFLYSFASTAEL
jgi:hypothetical protein